MNLIEESFQKKEENKKKRLKGIILGAIAVVIIMIISILVYLSHIQNSVLRLTLDGQQNEKLKQLLVIEEDGTIYLPIKEVASYFGYQSYNGEYVNRSENQSECYVESENEVANFSLGSEKIYKIDLTKNVREYEYVYSKRPVKAINGTLYATSEAIEKAFNVSFYYNTDTNRIVVNTMPYLVEGYRANILDYGYTEISEVFVNKKTILQSMLIVRKDKGQAGVIDLDGNIVLEPKYSNITYLPDTGDFLVETNKKVGIMSRSREMKVEIIYDEIKVMDSDAGLYVAKREGKYGILDTKGNIKINIENDEVGIDIGRFEKNDIKNRYILVNNLIPIRKGKYWGLFNKEGKQIVEFKYDSLGYIASNSKDAYNLLVIPEYNVLVVCKDKKYALVNSSGEELFATIADDIYMTISGGEKNYYIMVNDNIMDAEEYLDTRGVSVKSNNNNSNSNNNNNTQNQEDEDENDDNEQDRDNNDNEENNENNEE